MRSPTVALTYEGIETLMMRVADRLDRHREVGPLLTLNGVTATSADIRHALQAAHVLIDHGVGITIRPIGEGQRILVPIGKHVADAIEDELGEAVIFTMQS